MKRGITAMERLWKKTEDDMILFGTQYYRAPTPLKKDWWQDLKSIKNYGLNTLIGAEQR